MYIKITVHSEKEGEKDFIFKPISGWEVRQTSEGDSYKLIKCMTDDEFDDTIYAISIGDSFGFMSIIPETYDKENPPLMFLNQKLEMPEDETY